MYRIPQFSNLARQEVHGGQIFELDQIKNGRSLIPICGQFVGNAVIKIITLAKVGNGEPLANLHVGRKKHALRGRKSHQMGDRSGGWSRPEKINEAVRKREIIVDRWSSRASLLSGSNATL